MPSAQTWWWIGIGTGVTALTATGAVLVYRGRKRVTAPPEGTGLPPIEPTPKPDPITGLGLKTPGVDLRRSTCNKWVDGIVPSWSGNPAIKAMVYDAVDDRIADRDPKWSNIDELRGQSFYVARDALTIVCAQMPIPDTLSDAEFSPDFSMPYWQEIWGFFYRYAYNTIGDFGL